MRTEIIDLVVLGKKLLKFLQGVYGNDKKLAERRYKIQITSICETIPHMLKRMVVCHLEEKNQFNSNKMSHFMFI